MGMIESGHALLTGATALGCGLVAGGFFAFSTFVMPALRRLPPEEGIAAMQAINVAVLRSPFLAVFLGSGAGCGALSVIARWNHIRTAAALAAAVVLAIASRQSL